MATVVGGRWDGVGGFPSISLDVDVDVDSGVVTGSGLVDWNGQSGSASIFYSTEGVLDDESANETVLTVVDGAYTAELENPSSGPYYVRSSVTTVAGTAWSQWRHITISDAVPDAPTAVVGTAGNSSVSVAWVDPGLPDGGSVVTGFKVYTYLADDDSLVSTSTATASPKNVTSLSVGTEYYFKVSAVNIDGEGAKSAASAPVTTHDVPEAPAKPTLTAGNKQISVAYSAPATGGSAITGYKVYGFLDSDDTALVPASQNDAASPYAWTGLADDTAYYFAVAAVNANGEGPRSVVSDPATTFAVPGAPTGVAGTNGNTESSVSWTPPVANGGSAVTSYVVYGFLAADDSPLVPPSNTDAASPYVWTGLTNDVGVYFKVAAVTDVGEGVKSASSSTVTPTA